MHEQSIASGNERWRGRCRGGVNPAPIDPESALVASVLRRSLRMVEMDVWRLRHKNAKVLRLAIELSKREANTEAAAKAKVARHAKEQDRLNP